MPSVVLKSSNTKIQVAQIDTSSTKVKEEGSFHKLTPNVQIYTALNIILLVL